MVADIRKQIGDRIRDLRKKKGLSQEELGWKAKLHYTYIGGIERGEKNVSIITLSKIAKGLGISVNEIFNIPMDIKDPDKLRASLVKEINQSDPEIVRLVFNLTRELNRLKFQVTSGKERERK
ncbi:MAG: helix-turn-helix transcriptional regulator [Syntrophaceae bacterium]|nr:helix-turn-helix transcriptional regulator [Syntrophaceae bacterium]